MAIKAVYVKLNGSITTDISDVATLLPIDSETLAIIEDLVDFGGGDWTYLSLTNGVYTEEVKVTDVSGDNLVIVRGASGSTPMAFTALATYVTNVIGLDAVKDIIAATPVAVDLNLTGSGQANVTGVAPDLNIDVPDPTVEGTDGIVVTGTWPSISIAFEGIGSGCCAGCAGGGSGDGVTALNITSDILQGNISGVTLNLSLETPAFTGAGGITVTGAYPNFTITGSGAGSGTVTSVAAGAGLSLSGSPTVNPTIAMSNTGVTAGTYNGVVINARGQITGLPGGFAPLSHVTFNQGITVDEATTPGTAACTVASAAIGTKGIIAIADDGAPIDPTDDTRAVSPKMLAANLPATSSSTGGAAGSSTGEADASYTNTIGATSIAIVLAAGKKMALFAECEMLDGGAPLTPVAFGLAIFAATGPVALYKGKKATQSRQTIATVITGPLNDTIALVTTAVPGGSTVYSQSLIAISL